MSNPTDHAARWHCDLPPSSADKWLNCHGWFKETAGFRTIPETPSDAATEGTKAHELFEEHLRCVTEVQNGGVANPLHKSGAPEAMQDYLLQMSDWVEAQTGKLWLELPMDYGQVFGYVDLVGTGDITIWDEEQRMLTIADLKYGHGVVEVEDNPQLMLYAMGAPGAIGVDFDDVETFRTVILQPRPYHPKGPIREYSFGADEMKDFMARAEEAIAANYGAGEKRAGDHCRKWCKAFGSCETAAAAARQVWADNPLEGG